MLVISSCLPVGQMPGRLHQMKDQVGAGATVCDWSELAEDAAAALALVDRAFAEFAAGRPRPKHIAVPIDVLGQSAESGPVSPARAALPTASSVEIADLSTRLSAAKRPLFVFGGGSVTASAAARQVVERSGAASFTTYAGRGVIAGAYPLNFGSFMARPDSAATLAQADLVIAVGTELAGVDLLRDSLGHCCDLIRIDIDASVLDDCHGAEVKIVSDAGPVLVALAATLSPQPGKWSAAEVTAARSRWRAETDAARPGIAPLCDALRAGLPANSRIFSDMTQFAYVAKELFDLDQPRLWHHPFGFGTLGCALPAAIGGKIALPDQPVIAIAGDYGFQYTMPELGVAAELGLSLPIILWDNGKLKEIEDSMVRAQIAPTAVVAQNPDFRLLAAAYGVGYAAPVSIAGFQNALSAALAADGPTILHLTPATPG